MEDDELLDFGYTVVIALMIADCVTAAVRQVLKREDIDPARLGLIGHSWGAYQTAYIITQTPLFAAAVAGAPLTDMISMYNSIYWQRLPRIYISVC